MYQRLRNLREDRDLNQAAVAEILHVSQTTYSRYESGVLDVPSAKSFWTSANTSRNSTAYNVCWG